MLKHKHQCVCTEHGFNLHLCSSTFSSSFPSSLSLHVPSTEGFVVKAVVSVGVLGSPDSLLLGGCVLHKKNTTVTAHQHVRSPAASLDSDF